MLRAFVSVHSLKYRQKTEDYLSKLSKVLDKLLSIKQALINGNLIHYHS